MVIRTSLCNVCPSSSAGHTALHPDQTEIKQTLKQTNKPIFRPGQTVKFESLYIWLFGQILKGPIFFWPFLDDWESLEASPLRTLRDA